MSRVGRDGATGRTWAGVDNARFEVADVQQAIPGGPYEMAFSRFGTMFFANPVVALRNIAGKDRLIANQR